MVLRTLFAILLLVGGIACAGASLPTFPIVTTLPGDAGVTTLPTTSAVVTAAGNQLQIASTELDPTILMRGDRGTLAITVANTGLVPVHISRASLSGDNAVTVEDDPYQTVGEIGAGNRMTFTFSVRAGAPDGMAYPVFSLAVPDGRGIRVPVPVRVDSTEPVVSYIDKPDRYTVGKGESVSLAIGNPRQNALGGVMIAPRGTGFSSTPSSVFIGSLASNGQATASFNLTPDENASVGFELVYYNGLNRHSTAIELPVSYGDSKRRAELLLSNFVVEQNADVYRLTGDMSNAGLTPARSVVIQPGEGATPTDPYPRYVIGSLEPDDFASFELNFMARNLTRVPLVITYKDDDGDTFEERTEAALTLNQTSGSTTTGEPLPLVLIVVALVIAAGVGYLILRSWRR
jgi:hypothetical protein